MRIDPKPSITPTALDPKEPAPAKQPERPAPAAVVTLSSAGAAAAAPPGPSTTQRLERLRELVQRGDYPVDLDKLASRIVDDEMVRTGRK